MLENPHNKFHSHNNFRRYPQKMASLVRDAGDTEKKSSHLLNDKQRNERPQFAT